MGRDDWFVFGLLFGAIIMGIGAFLVEPVPDSIQECERELPRYQHCELVAVPKLMEGK